MTKKRQHFKNFKPSSSTPSASSSGDKTTRSVNDLLANLRRTSVGPSAPRPLTANSPSVPPAIREILQLPETPAPLPRNLARGRLRYDPSGRRLPAGPPPPRSWVSSRSSAESTSKTSSHRLKDSALEASALPGAYIPEHGSLLDLVLRRLADDWDFQREYNQYHIFFLPNHLKPALIRLISSTNDHGVSVADLKTVLLPHPEVYAAGEVDLEATLNREVSYLDLSGSLGRSIRLKEVTDLLCPSRQQEPTPQDPEESWDTIDSGSSPSPSRVLLPNLTHLSLALDPRSTSGGSWKQLLTLSSKLSNITHLNLAYWPDPCLTPQSRDVTVSSPHGRNIAYSGTGYYSHSLDQDWSEALLVLRMLSRNLYELEFLDLTGCTSWFPALHHSSGHDYIDWAGTWGKISTLRLFSEWEPGEDALPSEKATHADTFEQVRRVERHVRAMRAGQGRFISVERDSSDS